MGAKDGELPIKPQKEFEELKELNIGSKVHIIPRKDKEGGKTATEGDMFDNANQ